MAGLIPFNRKNNELAQTNTGYDDFYNMLDDFFNDSWFPSRSLLRGTFKVDIRESDDEYNIEAELPGIKKEEIDLSMEEDNLCISVNRSEAVNKDGENYIHRERRATSMSRRIRLANAVFDDVKAKLEDGVLQICVPKDKKSISMRKIEIE